MDFSEQAVLDEMSDEIGGYNVYNIYDQCKLAGDNSKVHTYLEWEELLGGSRNTYEFDTLPSHAALGEEGDGPDFGYLCGATRGEDAYLNQPSVRQALHVCSAAECGSFGKGTTWTAPYNR